MEIRSLLGLVHALLSATDDSERRDALAQLGDIFAEEEMPPLATTTIYYYDGSDSVFIYRREFASVLETELFVLGVSSAGGEWWPSLEDIDPWFLASNSFNHRLFRHLDEAEVVELLGDEYARYLTLRARLPATNETT